MNNREHKDALEMYSKLYNKVSSRKVTLGREFVHLCVLLSYDTPRNEPPA